MFSVYRPSSMGTSKYQIINHVVDDINLMGGIGYMDNGLYEISHKFLK